MSKKHYPLSPSASKRWINCPASLNAPNTSSSYAEEGTAAHDVAEVALRTGRLITPDLEVRNAVQVYYDYVRDLRRDKQPYFELIEDTREHATDPDLGGTADYLAIYEEDGKTVLHFVDYKHGAGVAVIAEENYQLLTYAVIYESWFGVEIDVYRMTIVQPRNIEVDPVQTWDCAPERVREHGKLIAKAKTQSHFKAGDHCRFCSLASTCQTLQDEMLVVARQQFDQAEVEDLLRLHSMADSIRAALNSLEETLVEKARAGVELPGYKVVESLGHRKWSAPEAKILSKLRRLGVKKKDAVITKLKSPAALEKLLDKDQRKKAFVGLITRDSVGFRIVEDSARGEELLLSANQVFDAIED